MLTPRDRLHAVRFVALANQAETAQEWEGNGRKKKLEKCRVSLVRDKARFILSIG